MYNFEPLQTQREREREKEGKREKERKREREKEREREREREKDGEGFLYCTFELFYMLLFQPKDRKGPKKYGFPRGPEPMVR